MKNLLLVLVCVFGWSINSQAAEGHIFKRAKLNIVKATGDFDVVYVMEPRIEIVMMSVDTESLEAGAYTQFMLVVDGIKADYTVSAVWKDDCQVQHFLALPQDEIGGTLVTGDSLLLMDQRASICIKPVELQFLVNIIRREKGMIVGTQSMHGATLPKFQAGPAKL